MIIKKEILLIKRKCMPGVGYTYDLGLCFNEEQKNLAKLLSDETIAKHIMDNVNESGGKYIKHYIQTIEDYDCGLPDTEWSGHKTKQGYETKTLHILIEV